MRAEMLRISQVLEAGGHVFTETSAMATFCIGIETLVGYGIKAKDLGAMVQTVAAAAYRDRAQAIRDSGRIVDPQGRPL